MPHSNKYVISNATQHIRLFIVCAWTEITIKLHIHKQVFSDKYVAIRFVCVNGKQVLFPFKIYLSSCKWLINDLMTIVSFAKASLISHFASTSCISWRRKQFLACGFLDIFFRSKGFKTWFAWAQKVASFSLKSTLVQKLTCWLLNKCTSQGKLTIIFRLYDPVKVAKSSNAKEIFPVFTRFILEN